jgi:anti-sigma B factor antagonist
VALYMVEKALDDVVLLDLRGRITLGDETARLRQVLTDLVNSDRRQIILSLEGVNYIDSSGLSTLVASFISVRKLGGDLKLAHLTTRVRDLLQITRLSTVFESYQTVEDAKKSFQQPGAVRPESKETAT